jgi:hypothetical protein
MKGNTSASGGHEREYISFRRTYEREYISFRRTYEREYISFRSTYEQNPSASGG